DNELVLEDVSVSRRHAQLSLEAGRLTVEDLGSANGTFIGGQRLVANVSSIVPVGQPIRLGEVEIRFTPPAAGEQATVILPAGAVPIQVGQATVILPAGAVPTPLEQALPFQGFVMNLQPIRSRRDFQLTLDNQGHAPVNYHLSASDDALADPSQALEFFFPQEAISLQPGQQHVVALSVSPKLKPKIGARETRNFTVTATPLDPDGVKVETAGQLLIQPPLPLWLIPLGLVLCLCACLGLASAYALCPVAGLPFCAVKPVIKVFTA